MTDAKTPMAPWIVLAAGVGMMVGSFMPWIQGTAPFVGTISRSGMDGGGDGTVTLLAGGTVALLAVAALTGHRFRGMRWLVALAAVGGLGVVWVDGRDVAQRVSDAQAVSDAISANIGAGLILVGVASLVAVVAAFALKAPRREPTP